MNRIKYSCKNCNWTTSIIEQWQDLKPKRCMNSKCNTSFRKTPEALITQKPIKVEVKKETQSKNEGEKHGKSSNKQKTSSKAKQQQTKSQDNL